ncbi:MAG: sigma-54-dependent Fis family transcriptional regulator [Victivallales bacterium]|jgi:DNA-binding NtrC family response regulator|nr:sigma-54-dependent Fis family transcriptional regulator [Victivallales bacterium]MBT7162158.1 sigma-54-dependent Fis family transcriptional regulator [Victivallales bacterium]MBT7302798.1 sigma-54-dependent Fis family transcriptional regulator [Victivallales bacterium]
MQTRQLILVVDDLRPQRELLAKCLREWGYEVVDVPSGDQAVIVMQASRIDLLITDVRMPGISGLELVPIIREHFPAVPVLLVTAFPDIRQAVVAIKDGAVDYLTKPVDLDELRDLVGNALGEQQPPDCPLPPLPDGIVFVDPAMGAVLRDAHRVAGSRATLVITGESGTGKEVLFDLICGWSSRAKEPAVRLNCAAIPAAMLESEMFGHAKGAFTGAVAARDGIWRTADGGTLLLDEIAELPLALQAKLLRALQDGSYSPLGSDRTFHADVRVIAATNKSLETEIEEGRFREDLYYRLNVVELHLPALRDRPADILPLAKRFLSEFLGTRSRLAAGTKQVLQAYPWPGNVRELRNMVERGSLMAQGDILLPEHLSPRLLRSVEAHAAEAPPLSPDEDHTLAAAERQVILAALARCDGNRTRAAKELGIGRRTLIYKLKAYEIESPPADDDEEE